MSDPPQNNLGNRTLPPKALVNMNRILLSLLLAGSLNAAITNVTTSTSNTGQGDSLRNAFLKLNWNDTYILSEADRANNPTNDWALVYIPDAQYLTNTTRAEMAAWVTANESARNVKMVMTSGDVVDDPTSAAQWANSTSYWHAIKAAGIPHLLTVGNHDYDALNPNPLTLGLTNWSTYYGSAYYSSETWANGGFYSTETNGANVWLTQRIAGQDWLFISLEWGPRTAVMDWAYALATNRPTHRVIISTHVFLRPDGTLDGQTARGPAYVYGVHDSVYVTGRNNAWEMWNGWLKKLPNLDLILCGHLGFRIDGSGSEYGDYERNHSLGRAVLRNDNGRAVWAIMSNYQGYATDTDQLTNGWFRIYTFAGDTLTAETYSTSYLTNRTGTTHAFTVPLSELVSPKSRLRVSSAGDGSATDAVDELADGLWLYLPLDEMWGTNATELVTGTVGQFGVRTGETLSASFITNGVSGGSLFLGNYSYLNLGNMMQPYLPAFSGSLWYRSFASGGAGTFISRYGTLSNSEFTVLVNGGNQLAITLTSVTLNQAANTWDIPQGAAWQSDGAWHHVGWCYDGTNVTAYWDGVSLGAKAGPTGGPWLNTSTQPIYVGDYAGAGGGTEYTLNGYIDEIMLWNRPQGPDTFWKLAHAHGRNAGVVSAAATQTIAAGTTTYARAGVVRVVGSGGSVTVTAAPSIPDGSDGQEVEVWGTSDTSTVTYQDLGTLASSNLKLGSTTRVLGLDDCIRLRYSSTLGYWVECGGTFGASASIGPDSVQLATHTTGNYVESITGTANEVTVSGSGSEAAAVTLSLPATVSLAGKTEFVVPSAAAPTVATAGEIAFDNDAHAASHGALKTFDGTIATILLGVDATDTPSAGHVPKWNADGTITWEVDSASAGGDAIEFTVLGPGAAVTGDAIARWDLTSGTNIQNSVVVIGDTGAVTGVDTIVATNGITASTFIAGATNVVGSLAGKQDSDADLARLVGVTWSAGDILRADANGITNAPLTQSSHLSGFLSDEQGSGAAVFATSPTITTPTLSGSTLSGTISVLGTVNAASAVSLTLPTGAPPTTDAAGEIAFQTDGWGAGHGAAQLFDGTSNVRLVPVLASDTPSSGQVPVFGVSGYATWEGVSMSDGDKGDITVSGSGSTLTIDADSVALGTDTTGNFMSAIFGTANEVAVSGSAGESSTWSIALSPSVDIGDHTSLEIPHGADPTTDTFGEIAGDNNAWASGRGALEFFDGTASTWLVGALASDTPSGGQVPKWNADGTVTWEDDNAGGVSDGDKGDITVATSGTVWTIDGNAVALGTDTTGNYVATIAGTANEITVTGSGSESAAITLSLPSDVTISNLTLTGGLTLSGSGGSALDSLQVTNKITNDVLTATKLVGSAADKSLTSVSASTGLGFDGVNLWLTNHSADFLTSGTVADARVASSIARLAGPTFTGSPALSTATATSVTIGTTNVVGALSTKAELAGPTFTGSPALSTATATSVTIGATNVVGALSTKAELDSPTFTGTVTVSNLTLNGTLTMSGSGGTEFDSIQVTNKITNSVLTATRVLFAAADKSLTDDSGLTYVAGTDTMTVGAITMGATNVTGELAKKPNIADQTYQATNAVLTTLVSGWSSTNLFGGLSTKAEISTGGTNIYGAIALKAPITSASLVTPDIGAATGTSLTMGGTNVVGALALKAPLADPVFTGSLAVPQSDDTDVDAAGEISWDTDGWLRGWDGTRQVAIARAIETIHATVVAPNDLADAVRDACLIWSNESGMSFVVTGWKAWSGTDDTTLNIEETDADGQNNATVDAVEIATNGTGVFTGADTTITAATIENGHLLFLDFDDTDAPTYVKVTIYGYYDANVN